MTDSSQNAKKAYLRELEAFRAAAPIRKYRHEKTKKTRHMAKNMYLSRLLLARENAKTGTNGLALSRILPLACVLFCWIHSGDVQAQSREYAAQGKVIQFSGVVVNGLDSKPLPFSTVLIRNQNRGTVADASGFFSFVAVIGDTVDFSMVGFAPRQLVIPDTIRHDAYSIVMPLEQDTVMLMETVIYPWPSREKFREAFLSLKLPETESDIIRKNFNLAAIREQASHGKMDADMNYRSLMQQQTTQLYYQNQVTPNNLLNPFAWAQFIKQWRRRKDADKMIEQQSQGYQQYENSSSSSDDYQYDE